MVTVIRHRRAGHGKRQNVSVVLDEDQVKALERISLKYRATRSGLIRLAIDEFIHRNLDEDPEGWGS